MSLKNNYKELSKKLGGHYTLIKKGIKRGWIDSIMQGSDIGVSKAYEIAKVLGVTMEELLTGNYEEKKVYSPDKQKYIDKLIEILNGNDDQKKNAIITILDNLKRDAWNDSLKKQQAG
ncbi:MAG: hypothetical protein KGJ87_05225 [Planctomycetota bacterium]|nr:hypothetical protein [Planctomycetota bacterium]